MILNKASARSWTWNNNNYVRNKSHSIKLLTPKLHTAAATFKGTVMQTT